jgi:hypothetical protein
MYHTILVNVMILGRYTLVIIINVDKIIEIIRFSLLSILLLEHLQQLFQIDYKVKFNSFCGILMLQQLLQNESFLTICYSELSYMKVHCSTCKYYFILFSLSPPSPSLSLSSFSTQTNASFNNPTPPLRFSLWHLFEASPVTKLMNSNKHSYTVSLASLEIFTFVGRAFFMIRLTFTIGKTRDELIGKTRDCVRRQSVLHDPAHVRNQAEMG